MEYKHKSLDLSTQEIRLFRIASHQTATSPTISCTIQHINLQCDAHPAYKVLSYARGGTPTKEISIDEKSFCVTESIYTFLESVQDDEGTLFWIDQLCLDQTNIAEKNHQVTIVDSIYRSASGVVVWLGPAADGSDIAIQAIERISGSGTNPNVDLSERQKVFMALKDLFRRSYWHCLWAIQEIVHPPHVVIWCGTMRVQWSILKDFLVHPRKNDLEEVFGNLVFTRLRVYGKRSMGRTFGAGQILRLTGARYEMGGGRYKEKLSDVIEDFPESRCDDPRDRVYALLSLVSPDQRVVVDYSKPVEEVVFDVWEKIKGPSREDHRLQLNIDDDSDDDYGFEDWVPKVYWDIRTIAELVTYMELRQRFFPTGPSLPSWSEGQYYAVKTLLLSENFNPNWKDRGGISILSWAIEDDREDIIKLLLATDRVEVAGAVEAMVRESSEEVMRILISHRGSEIEVTNATLEAAAANKDHAGRVMKLLLDHPGSDVSITEAMVKAAAENRGTGNEAMVALLNRRRKDVGIMEDTVERYVRDFDDRVMEALLASREEHILITEAVVKAAETKGEIGNRILEALLSRRETDLVVTEEIIETFASKFNGKVMEAVLRRCGTKSLLPETAIPVAAKNLGNGGEVMAALFAQGEPDIAVTGAVVEAAAANEGSGGDLMKVLFHHRGSDIQITQAVLKAAAGNLGNGTKVIKSILAQRGEDILITKTIVEAAARNKRCGSAVIKALLNREGEGVVIDGEAEAAIARHFKWVGRPLMSQKPL